jgi:hypothetical protein
MKREDLKASSGWTGMAFARGSVPFGRRLESIPNIIVNTVQFEILPKLIVKEIK